MGYGRVGGGGNCFPIIYGRWRAEHTVSSGDVTATDN